MGLTIDQSVVPGKTTRSILVIEDELEMRVSLMDALSAEHWSVVFALTENSIQEAIQNVVGVILSWDLSDQIDLDSVIKIIGELPMIVTSKKDECSFPGFIKKPYSISDLVKETKIQIAKSRFFVGDLVISKTTPDWGYGRVVSIYQDNFYGVIFKNDQHRNASEIALRCHYSGLKWAKD